MFIPIVCVHGKTGGCVEVATLFLNNLHSVGRMFLLLTDGNEQEKETFVFVPSRTAEVIDLRRSEVDPGRGEFLLCLLFNACVVLFAKHGMRKITSNLFIPVPLNILISCPMLFMLMNVVSHLFNF